MSKNAHTVDISGREHLEQWAAIPGYEGLYEASSLGRVRNTRKLQVLKQRLHSTRGYPVVELCKEGVSRETLVHRLVLLAFRGLPAQGYEGCHNNGIRTDNRLDNLRWDSHSGNSVDQVRHGTHRNTRKTHCVRGHEFTVENTYVRPKGSRMCRTCRVLRDAQRAS